ncbi:unnamed protein product [Sphagnum tenellum]
MKNKRQRLALKRKLEEAADSGAEAEAGNEVATEKKIGAKKRLRQGNDEASEVNSSGKKNKKVPVSKHPLRAAGMKPGEGCFLCKSKDHIAKNCPQKNENRNKMCLSCRQWGHTLKNCPRDAQEEKFCYNCGEAGHRLANCPQPLKDGGTSFAECFLCKELGHISKNCPSNTHGIYPKGGSCKVCGGITHLAKDCPQKASSRNAGNGPGGVALASQGAKRTVFRSGDDLEDDFVMEDGGGVSHTSELIDEGEILDGSIDLANTLDHMENLKSNPKHKITTSKKNVVTPKIVTFKS